MDEVHDEQFRRITKFVEARYDSGFPLYSLDVDVSAGSPISKQAQMEYTEAWGVFVKDVTFSVRVREERSFLVWVVLFRQ